MISHYVSYLFNKYNQNSMVFFFNLAFTYLFIGFFNCLKNFNRNILIFMIAAELMFFGFELTFIGTSFLLNDIGGVVIGLLVVCIVLAETIVGFGLCYLATKTNKKINFATLQTLRL